VAGTATRWRQRIVVRLRSVNAVWAEAILLRRTSKIARLQGESDHVVVGAGSYPAR